MTIEGMVRRLLVLRPEPGGAVTVARAEAAGFATTAVPLFAIVPVTWNPPDPAAHDALMLTSANAVRQAGEALATYRHLPTYAVGEATAAAARAAGFRDIHTGQTDATELLDRMAANGVKRPLHLTGREHRDAAHPALTITRHIVYAADPVPALPASAGEALAAGAIGLLHSPRAASLFATLVADRATIRIAAISPATAQAAGAGWRTIAIATAPTDTALLEAAASLS
jgi:uroporphyrinogen-III synthase